MSYSSKLFARVENALMTEVSKEDAQELISELADEILDAYAYDDASHLRMCSKVQKELKEKYSL